MTLEDAVQLAEILELFGAEVSLFPQHAVEGGGCVALGEHQTVPGRIRGVLRIDVHHVKVQRHQHLYRRKRAARMPGTRIRRHVDDIAPHLGTDVFKGWRIHTTQYLPC